MDLVCYSACWSLLTLKAVDSSPWCHGSSYLQDLPTVTAAATVADALECLVCIASTSAADAGGAAAGGAAAVLQLGGLEAATKALAAAVGNATTGLGLSSSSSRKSLDAGGGIGLAAAAGGVGVGAGGAGGAAASLLEGGILAEREQRRVAMLAVRLVAILLQEGGLSRIQVLSGTRRCPEGA